MKHSFMPSRRISNWPSSRENLSLLGWHYVYVLQSEKDDGLYIGRTINLKRRIGEHNTRKSFATAPRAPFDLICAEVGRNEDDAKRREHYLKTTQGRRFLKLRLRSFLKRG